LDLARKFLDASVAIREQVSGQNSVDYGTGLIKLGDLAQRQGHRDEATSDYSRAIQAIGERPEASPALLEIGVNTLSHGDTESAFGHFQHAANIDPAHAQTALMWMAVVRSRKTETAGEAEVLFQKALTQGDLDPIEKAAILDLYAGMLRRAGRSDEADALTQQAAGVRKSAAGSVTKSADLPTGVYRVGNGVTSPVPIFRPEPEYSEEARLAKYSGTVTLQIEIGPDGVPFNIQVVDGLGLGLDERAIESVSQWRFKPGTKDGVPVTVKAQIQVNFRLL
jgi:TonB family protein